MGRRELASTLAQIAVRDESNGIVAIPRLLALLDLRSTTVTIDAMGCQKAIAAAIVDRGADYVLALKDNHPTLHAEVAEFFADAEKSGWRDTPHSSDETTDGGHGRVEVRRVWASDEIEWLDPKGAWKGLHSIVMRWSVSARRGRADLHRARLLPDELLCGCRKLGDIVRRHWSIENSLHWTLDVTFDEESSRIRSKNGVQDFAALRKIALALLEREASGAKLGVAQKRKLAQLPHGVPARRSSRRERRELDAFAAARPRARAATPSSAGAEPSRPGDHGAEAIGAGQ